MKPLVRWTIGHTTPDGYDCLIRSITAFTNLYEADVVICHNCDVAALPKTVRHMPLYDQRSYTFHSGIPAVGVAWKLYPPRLTPDRHEIAIDNDLIIHRRLPQIDHFLNNDCTLLLEGDSRTYGRFARHVPPNLRINSGIYGMPPDLDLRKYVDFYAGTTWEENAFGEHAANRTFDEQGLIAFALLSWQQYVIIPETSITNCEHRLIEGDGCHFIALNRRHYHQPYRLYKWSKCKSFF